MGVTVSQWGTDDRRETTVFCVCLCAGLTSLRYQLPALTALAGNLSAGASWSTALIWTCSSESWRSPSSFLLRLSVVRFRCTWGKWVKLRWWVGDNLYNFSFLETLRSPTLPHLKFIQSALKPVCFDFTNFFPPWAFSFSFYCCSLPILYILSKLLPLFSPLSDSLSYSLNQCRNLGLPA